MANYDLLTNLLPLLAKYEEEKGSLKTAELADFATWLSAQIIVDQTITDKRLNTAASSDAPRGEQIPVTLGKLVYYMYRYARFYTRKALKDNLLNSLDEFTFLVTLLHFSPVTKTELIHKMVYDKTSGIEIIKRFIKLGLVSESDNPADKRSKLIALTDMGRGLLFSSFEDLGKVSNIIPGNLTAGELQTLIFLLDKLDHHHLHIWDNHKDADLDTILSSVEKK